MLNSNKRRNPYAMFLMALIMAQPFLDVLSYYLINLDKTIFTTLLRLIMFAGIMLFSFVLSDNKKAYYILAAVAGGYFALHAANCFRIGYVSLVDDAANFLRTVQPPALAIAFITVLKKIENPARLIGRCFLINILVVWGVIGASNLFGSPVYTIPENKLCLMCWFGVHNAQSAIVMLLVPLALCFAYRSGKIIFALTTAACFALLYFTGTRLTFYSVFLVGAAFLVLLLVGVVLKERPFKRYALGAIVPALVVVAAVLISSVFADASPMYKRIELQNVAYGNHQQNINTNASSLHVNSSDTSSDDFSSDGSDSSDTQEPPLDDVDYEKYEELYRGVAGGVLNDIIDEFGIERVAEKYNYTQSSAELLNTRQRKQIFAELKWEDSDLLTRMVGYEYSTLVTDKEIYDLENDFPAVFYFSGYLGFALYIAFIIYFVWLAAKTFFTDFKRLITMESGMLCLSVALLLGAAQFSGNVLRRPNVSIYLSLLLACMYIMYSKNKGENAKHGSL